MVIGQLRTVGVTVENGEDADEDRGERKFRMRFAGHHQAKEQRRESDTDLDAGKLQSDERQHPPKRHDHWEYHWKNPERGIAHLRSPQTNRDHRENVIDPGDGMKETTP